MKSATFGMDLSLYSDYCLLDGECPNSNDDLLLRDSGEPWFVKRRELSLAAYRAARTNGAPGNHPGYDFPADGEYFWHKHTDGYYYSRYSEGPGDREWMKQCDRNYLARLDAKKTATAHKQASEAQLREAQEKLKREQPLKEEAEEQLKAVEDPLELGQRHLLPGVSVASTPSSAQVPSASPTGYTGYTTPTSGEAAGTAGIFTAANPNLAAANQSGTPGASGDYQMHSGQ
jgi:hypothetical protein